MKIKNFKTKEEALFAARERLITVLKTSRKYPTLLLLSGGSALSLLDEIEDIYGINLTIAPLDERYSKDSSVNNMAQIAETEFYMTVRNIGCNIIDTRVRENETQKELADRFDVSLNRWLSENPNGKIIATVGIGEDGHTSGMMPFPYNPRKFGELFNGERLVVAYDAGDKNEFPKRVTTTLTLMRKIDNGIVYVVGDNKKEALTRLIAADGSIAATPARILREMKDVELFTDQKV